jgi:hypothetical protein
MLETFIMLWGIDLVGKAIAPPTPYYPPSKHELAEAERAYCKAEAKRYREKADTAIDRDDQEMAATYLMLARHYRTKSLE